MGTFEIPSSVPLIGLNEISDLRIMIKENGISATRIIIHFMKSLNNLIQILMKI